MKLVDRMNSAQSRAILAGLGMFAGLQLSGDPLTDAVILVVFVVGGWLDKTLGPVLRRKLEASFRTEDAE